MIPANDNRTYSTLPTFHLVRMELTRLKNEAENDEAAFVARRAAWFAKWGL